MLRSDTDQLMNKLMESVEDVLIDVQPEIYSDFKQLKADIKEQKLERQFLQKTLEQLYRSTEEQRAKVKFCKERIAAMEDSVGMIANTEAYKNAEDASYQVGQEKDLASLQTDSAEDTDGNQAMLNVKSSNKEIMIEDGNE